MEDFEVPNPLGTIILDKSAEEMEAFLNTGDFDGGSAPVRRESGNYQQSNGGGYTRRTPASGEGRRQSF